MKKKFFAVLALGAVMLTALVGCGTCKEDGCDEEVYKDGYCEVHYTLHAAGEALEDLADQLD
ncbi:MAG: hypothetical protein J6K77_06190 [Ruminococcus sp.]|nr:hypothetical protein [Ruminococcus sp.]